MSKKFQLQIPTPCHENWDNMSPVEKGRFCSSCQKQVVDFSRMSDREVAIFFKKPSTGSVCGRFMEDQLNRDIEIPKKRIPWVKYFFQFLLPGFLISMRATAQGNVKLIKKDSAKVECSLRTIGNPDRPVMGDTILPTEIVTTRVVTREFSTRTMGLFITVPPENDSWIRGRVINNKGELIPFATIKTANARNIVKTEVDGSFKIKPKKNWKGVFLTATAEGHEAKTVRVLPGDSPVIVLTPEWVDSEIVITAGTVLVTKNSAKENDTTNKEAVIPAKLNKPSSVNRLKVYPNPVKSNATLHIEWNQTESGYHVLQLFNVSGQLIFTKEMFIDEEAKLLSVDLPSLTTGNYFIKMTNKKTSRSYTSKILVQ